MVIVSRNYNQIPISALHQAQDAQLLVGQAYTHLQDACPQIDANMLWDTIKKNVNDKVYKKLMLHLWEHPSNGPMIFKQIALNTFVTSVTTQHANKNNLFHMDLKSYNNNIVYLHKAIKAKVMELKVVGHSHPKLDLLI